MVQLDEKEISIYSKLLYTVRDNVVTLMPSAEDSCKQWFSNHYLSESIFMEKNMKSSRHSPSTSASRLNLLFSCQERMTEIVVMETNAEACFYDVNGVSYNSDDQRRKILHNHGDYDLVIFPILSTGPLGQYSMSRRKEISETL